jgi:hypothetical protein
MKYQVGDQVIIYTANGRKPVKCVILMCLGDRYKVKISDWELIIEECDIDLDIVEQRKKKIKNFLS